MKTRKSLALFTTGSLLIAVSAQAAEIVSVNFVTSSMTNISVISGTYGVEPAANWNNIISTTSNLTNDSGVATTVDVATVRPNGNAFWPAAYSNTVLYAGIRENLAAGTRSSATISDLNANFPTGYKVIAYLNGASTMTASLVTDGTTTNYYKTLWTPGNFTGALTETTDEDYDGTAASVPIAQYAVFGSDVTPLTDDSITLTMDALLSAAASLCGFQIVGVSPPALPEGAVFYDDFGNYTDADGKVAPTRSMPFDWSLVVDNVWDGTASTYVMDDWGSYFGATNATDLNAQSPADSTNGVALKVGYWSQPAYTRVVTINTGIKYNINSNYTFKTRAKLKHEAGDTSGDAAAVGQINFISGYYNPVSSNFVSVKSENVTNLTATGWMDIEFSSNGARVGTNALGKAIILRMARQNFVNSSNYVSWVDYIQIDASSPVDDWLASQGLTNASWTADADGDGIDNFTEFATGGDPNDPGSTGYSGPSYITEVNGTNRLAYVTPRQVDYWANGVDYYLERNTDLVNGTWVGAGTWVVGTGIQAYSPEFDARTNYLGNIGVNDQQFLRLRVTHPSYNP